MAAPPLTLWWVPTGVSETDVVDAALHPLKRVYTVTGARRKELNQSIPQLGVEVTLRGKSLALFRYSEAVFAVSARCPHAQGRLALGDIEAVSGNLMLHCPVHSFSFSLATGDATAPPFRPCSVLARHEHNGRHVTPRMLGRHMRLEYEEEESASAPASSESDSGSDTSTLSGSSSGGGAGAVRPACVAAPLCTGNGLHLATYPCKVSPEGELLVGFEGSVASILTEDF